MRHVTNSRGPIRSVDDLKGLKMRLQPSETHLASFRALGANPVAMDVKELYSALEQKVVDAQENPYTVISASRYGEVQKHLSNSGHFFDFIAVIGSKKALEQLKPEHQKAVREAMTATIAFQRKLAIESEAKALADLKTKMTYTEISPAVREEMRKADGAGDRRGRQEARRCRARRAGAGRSGQALMRRTAHHAGPRMRKPVLPVTFDTDDRGRAASSIVLDRVVLAACCWSPSTAMVGDRLGAGGDCATASTSRSTGPTSCRGWPSSGASSWRSRSVCARVRTSASTSSSPSCPRRLAAAAAPRRRAAVGAAMMAIIAWAALGVAIEQWDELMSVLDWSVGWFIVPVGVSARCCRALHLVRIALRGSSRAAGRVSACRLAAEEGAASALAETCVACGCSA